MKLNFSCRETIDPDSPDKVSPVAIRDKPTMEHLFGEDVVNDLKQIDSTNGMAAVVTQTRLHTRSQVNR